MRTLAGKETLPDNGVLLTLAAARAFFGDEPDVLIVRSGHPLVRISRERGALTLEDLRAYP